MVRKSLQMLDLTEMKRVQISGPVTEMNERDKRLAWRTSSNACKKINSAKFTPDARW